VASWTFGNLLNVAQSNAADNKQRKIDILEAKTKENCANFDETKS